MLQILENVSLQSYNSFRIDVKAKYFIEIKKKEELRVLFSQVIVEENPILIVGGGSNILFTKDFNGLIIKLSIPGIDVKVVGDKVFVTAGAGVVWSDFVDFCVQNSYGGVENLSLIPGTVGASPVQNIGAYGVELKDVFHSCEAFEIEAKSFKNFNFDDCGFGYRESVFKGSLKGKYIITSVTFKLNLNPKLNISYGAISSELNLRNIANPNISDVAKVVSDIRVSKLPDPSTIGNAGSFFKNPIVDSLLFNEILSKHKDLVNYPLPDGNYKLAAGWLIEQCGWKGKAIGDVGIWKNQALVLVNHGHATGEEVFNFSEGIIDSVYQKFSVKLEREVNII